MTPRAMPCRNRHRRPAAASGYAQTPTPKYLVEFAWASHMAWTDLGISDHDAIIGYAIAFLDHYVKDAPEAPALHAALPGGSIFRRD